MSIWQPSYAPWRHGGWYVLNTRYPNGGCGCVSNNYPDKKWRIVCDDRRKDLGAPGDFTFKTRDAAARGEHELVEWMKAAQEHTPRQLEEAMRPGCPKSGEVERLYQARIRFVERLKAIGAVTLDDLGKLDRLGRFQVANECWAICSDDARKALLEDSHHQVKSTASISQSELFAEA